MALLRSGITLAAVALAIAGCGISNQADPEAPSQANSVTSQSSGGNALRDLVIEPGNVGPFVVGMPASEALAAGLVSRPANSAACPRLKAVKPFQDLGVVFSESEAEPKLLGVLVKVRGPETDKGIGVGDSIEDLKTAYGDAVHREVGDYGETIYRIYAGDRAMGFGISEDGGEEIDAIEVFAKSDPVGWDGC